MFRIQNDEVMKKAKSKPKAKARPQQPQSSVDTHEETNGSKLGDAVIPISRQNVTPQNPWALGYSMFPTIEERARGFFKSNAPLWLRNTDLLDDMVNQTRSDEHLLTSIYAVGLASLSNVSRSSELMVQARSGYVAALKLTNQALRSPTEAKKDSTLFAVMILGIFETLAGTSADSIMAWTQHVYGASALVEFRGMDQLNSAAGQRMFYQVMSNVMISCIQRSTAMPPRILEMRQAAAKFMNTEDPLWVAAGLIIEFTSFIADVKECRIVGPRTIINAALALDARLVATFAACPADWAYHTVKTDESPHLIWNGTYHTYLRPWVPQIWNGMRTCRILLGEQVRNQLLASAGALTPLYTEEEFNALEAQAVSVILQMQADVLASIPFQPRSSWAGDQVPDMLGGMHNAFILWPLYLIGAMDLTTTELRLWVAARLQMICDMAGIGQAGLLAGYIREKQEFWDSMGDLKPWKETPGNVHEVVEYMI